MYFHFVSYSFSYSISAGSCLDIQNIIRQTLYKLASCRKYKGTPCLHRSDIFSFGGPCVLFVASSVTLHSSMIMVLSTDMHIFFYLEKKERHRFLNTVLYFISIWRLYLFLCLASNNRRELAATLLICVIVIDRFSES